MRPGTGCREWEQWLAYCEVVHGTRGSLLWVAVKQMSHDTGGNSLAYLYGRSSNSAITFSAF
jgi:hypothetical protein